MKIRIQTTIELSEHDEAALRLYWEEIRDEGETFRDWYKSSFVNCGHCWFEEKIADYGRFVGEEPQETYGLDDRFAKDAHGNTIVIARVGDPKP
ncbi:MAG: hypothetical protein ACPGJW_00460 [Paracoccaceae bacterium]